MNDGGVIILCSHPHTWPFIHGRLRSDTHRGTYRARSRRRTPTPSHNVTCRDIAPHINGIRRINRRRVAALGRVGLRARVLLDMYNVGAGDGSPQSRQAVAHLGAGTEGLIAEAYRSLLQEPEELADDRYFLESVQRCIELKRLSQDGGGAGWSDEAEDAYSPFKK